jgi:hypothetical protein
MVGTVPVFRQQFVLENVIELHAFAPRESLAMRVTNGILLWFSLLLPVDTANPAQTRKVW